MAGTTTDIEAPNTGRTTRVRELTGAEWIKFRSVRSSYWALFAAAVSSLLVGILIAYGFRDQWLHWTPAQRAASDSSALGISFDGFQFSQLVAGALGVLVIGAEYSTGLIRTTFAAVPLRASVLFAKAAVLGAITLVVGLVLALAAFFPVQAILHGIGLGVSITSPGVPRAILSVSCYMAVVALIGVGFGALLRYTAGALAAVFGLLFLLPGVVSSLPSPWDVWIGKFLPSRLVRVLFESSAQPGELSHLWAGVTLAAYPVVLLTAAAYVIRRRDV